MSAVAGTTATKKNYRATPYVEEEEEKEEDTKRSSNCVPRVRDK